MTSPIGVRGQVRWPINDLCFKEMSPVDSTHAYTRVTYTKVSETQFTWTGEKSADGSTWNEFMVVECHRSSE